MQTDLQKVEEIREIVTLKVTSRGSSACVILPKGMCDTYHIVSGDKLKIQIRDHWKPKREGGEEH